MICCEPTIVTFNNVESTSIPYSVEMRRKHGDYPTVQVLYYNEESEDFDLSIDATRVELQGSPVERIVVNHGGLMAGVIKVS